MITHICYDSNGYPIFPHNKLYFTLPSGSSVHCIASHTYIDDLNREWLHVTNINGKVSYSFPVVNGDCDSVIKLKFNP